MSWPSREPIGAKSAHGRPAVAGTFVVPGWVGVWDGSALRPARTALKVIVTRPRGQAGPLAARIEALGHEVVECPLIEIVPIDDGPVDTSGYDWLVLTSPNGAAELARRRTGGAPPGAAPRPPPAPGRPPPRGRPPAPGGGPPPRGGAG